MDGTVVSNPLAWSSFELMAISLSDILATLQNGDHSHQRLEDASKSDLSTDGETFSAAARGSIGTVTLDASQALGFMPVTTSSGYVGYVPIYPVVERSVARSPRQPPAMGKRGACDMRSPRFFFEGMT